MVQAVSGIEEGLDRLALAEAMHVKPFLALTLGQPREIAVGAGQNSSVKGALVHEVHW